MKKLQLVLVSVMMIFSCFIFASCAKKVESVSFGVEQIEMEVGETYDLKAHILPEKFADEVLTYSTSNNLVVYITPNKEVLALATGIALVEARASNGKTGYLKVIVTSSSKQLTPPIGIIYDEAKNRITWPSVRNANSYTVMINDTIVAEGIPTNFYEYFASGEVQNVSIRTNGIGGYVNSEFSEVYSFEILSTPTDLEFNKETRTVSWQSDEEHFRVVVNNIMSEVVEDNEYVLPFSDAGDYTIKVLAVSDGEDNVFSSRESEPLTVKRLNDVNSEYITWNTASKRLSWASVDGASYQLSITGQESQILSESNISLPNLSRGLYTVIIKTVSTDTMTLNGLGEVSKEVTITHKLETPLIESYDASNFRISFSNYGDASEFVVLSDDEVIYSATAQLAESSTLKYITLDKDYFTTAGDHIVKIYSKADPANYLLQSDTSEGYTIKRLTAPSNFRIENNRNLTWGVNPYAVNYSYVVSDSLNSLPPVATTNNYVDAYDFNEDTYYTVSVTAIGNGNTTLSSTEGVYQIKKLSTPSLSFNKEDGVVTINCEDENSSLVKIGDADQQTFLSNTFTLDVSQSGTISIISQTIPKNNEILSNPSEEINIIVLAQIENLRHYVQEGISYIEFDSIPNATNYSATLTYSSNAPTNLELIEIDDSNPDKTTLKVINDYATIFASSGNYLLNVKAVCSSEKSVDTTTVSYPIYKLAKVSRIQFAMNENRVSWSSVQRVQKYKITRHNSLGTLLSDNEVPADTTQFVYEGLELGEYSCFVYAIGNASTILNSDISEVKNIKKEMTLSNPVLSFAYDNNKNRVTATCTDEEVAAFEFYIGNELISTVDKTEGNTASYEFNSAFDTAGNYTVKVKAINADNQYVLNSGLTTKTITRLAVPSSIQSTQEKISWLGVNGATSYSVKINTETSEVFTNEKNIVDLTPGLYTVSVFAQNNNVEEILPSAKTTVDNLEIRKTLNAPTSLVYNKETNSLSFVTDNRATHFDVFINGTKQATSVTSGSFTFYESDFTNVGTYTITAQARNEDNSYYDMSVVSVPINIERLSAPTEISVDVGENVHVAFDDTKIDFVRVLVNGIEKTSLVEEDGAIDIKAMNVAIVDAVGSNYYLDSTYSTFSRTRLVQISNLKLSRDSSNHPILTWESIENTTNYILSIKPFYETQALTITLENDAVNYSYDFERIGTYDISIYAKGDLVNYLNARNSNVLTVTKPETAFDLALRENVATQKVEITFKSDAENISSYQLYIQAPYATEFVHINGEFSEEDVEIEGTINSIKKFTVDSSIFNTPGIYNIIVKSIGNNNVGVADSIISQYSSNVLSIRKLSAPDYVYMQDAEGMIYWYGTGSETYRLTIYDEHNGVDNPTIWVDETISVTNYDFSELFKTTYASFVGIVNIRVISLGNDTTLLRSGSIVVPYERIAAPEINVQYGEGFSLNNIKVSANIANSLLELYIYRGTEIGDAEAIAQTNNYNELNLNINDGWEAGSYVIAVYEKPYGQYFVSTRQTRVITILNNVDVSSIVKTRDSEDEDIMIFTWEPVVNAASYYVSVATQSEYMSGEKGTLVYAGAEPTFTLPETIPDGNIFFIFRAIGSSIALSSSTAYFNQNKLVSDSIYAYNNNGVLAWNNNIGTMIMDNTNAFKIVVNTEDPIYFSKEITSYDFVGLSGQLNIKIKARASLDSFGIDSNYLQVSILKLFTPTDFRVVKGEFKFNDAYNSSEQTYQIKVGQQVFDVNTLGLESLSAYMTPGVEYNAQIRAIKTASCLTSDYSSTIPVKILANPSTEGGTRIVTNAERTQSWLQWTTVTGASEYEVEIVNSLQEKTTKIISSSDVENNKTLVSDLDPETYTTRVRRVGETGLIEGFNYLSSSYSTAVPFVVLAAPELSVSKGELVWTVMEGASTYYIYDNDTYINAGNVSSYSFFNEYVNHADKTDYTIFVKAIGDGTYYVSSKKQVDGIELTKPRPPTLFTLIDGALAWTSSDTYTYYASTQNRSIYLEFSQNGTVYESFEAKASNFYSASHGWPYESNYLAKLTQNLPAGLYNLKIKQIGDNNKVITSEYQTETIDLNVCPKPTNVKIENSYLSWDAVSLPDYKYDEESELITPTYIIYIYDSARGGWKYFSETTNNYFDLTNDTANLLTSFTAISVAIKGNSEADTETNYMTGNMSDQIDITVLGQPADLRTDNGSLSWGSISQTANYIINAGNTYSKTISGQYTSYDCFGLVDGEHLIKVRALGNGSSGADTCILNGVWSLESTFTKLGTPTNVKTVADINNTSDWGRFYWDTILNNSGYMVYLDANSIGNGYLYYSEDVKYASVENAYYESTVEDTAGHTYQFQALGNTALPTVSNVAYISSDLSSSLTRYRYAQLGGLMVYDGILYWTQSVSTESQKYYFVEFSQNNELVARVCVKELTENVLTINGMSKVGFDVASYIGDGEYQVNVRETNNSNVYITGIPSETITLSKLKEPTMVELVYGALTWPKVDGAAYYVVRAVNKSTTEISSFEVVATEDAMQTWNSTLQQGIYYISVRAVAETENILKSSWVNNNGIVYPESIKWEITQMPALSTAEIDFSGDNIVWAYTEGTQNLPEDVGYVIWPTGTDEPANSSYTTETQYAIREGMSGIKIKTIPTGEVDFFASEFSNEKLITTPSPVEGLVFDEIKQIFTWNQYDTDADTKYIVIYSLNGGEEQTVYNILDNKFVPSSLGEYELTVRVQKSTSAIGISDRCESVGGTFNLFTAGDGLSEATAYQITSANIQNIMYRPSACFKLIENNLNYADRLPIGYDTESSTITAFTGNFNGDGKTIKVGWAQQQKTSSIGLFSMLGDNSNVKNLNIVVDSNINLNVQNGSSSQVFAGIVAGQLNGVNATITNCRISASSTISVTRGQGGQTFFGGIVGRVGAPGATANKGGLISSTSTSVSYTFSSASHVVVAGGIAGYISKTSTIENCSNSGALSGANITGGIVGSNYGTISDCFNSGAITTNVFDLNSVSSSSIAGGIVGQNNGNKTESITDGGIILTSTNSGTITAGNTLNLTSKTSYAGGIVGELVNGGKVNGCTNRGLYSYGETNASTYKDANAIFGKESGYIEESLNYMLMGQKQTSTASGEMTIQTIVA